MLACIAAVGRGEAELRIPRAAVPGASPRTPLVAEGDPTAAQVLVVTEEDWPDFFDKAAEIIEAGNYERAIHILQALADRESSGFVARSDGRYVGLAARAGEVLAGMPPEGLKLYRGLYDGKAGHVYRTALKTGGAGPLQRIVHQYPHTSYGPRARDRLGLIHFDQGRFAEAARSWALLLDAGRSPVAEPLLLARIATARHLAGDRDAAVAALKQLRQNYPSARDRIAGRDVNLVAYVERMHELPVATRRRVLDGWPGLGGVADGQAVMEGTEVAPAPGWLHPPDATGAETVPLLAGETLLMQAHSRRMALLDLRGGRVVLEIRQDGRRVQTEPAANLIHPLVVDGTVVYRTDRAVIARDLLSGRRLWTNDDLPLFRSVVNQYPAGMMGVSDRGSYHLTSGGGLVFVRCGLDPPVARRQIRHFRGSSTPVRERTSTLRALRLKDGRSAWPALGDGRGPDEVVRKGDFVSPVTYSKGRGYL
ncbi:MAG: tetratricopeptide repeat protein, partial [Planctomycetota bacterium]